VSLVTRCPTCGTAFRVQPAQLSVRGGRVRCGKCATVFDGVAGLLAEGAAPTGLPEPSPQLGLFDPSRRPAAAPEPAVSPRRVAPVANVPARPPSPVANVPASAPAPAAAAAPAAVRPAAPRLREQPLDEDDMEVDFLVDEEPRPAYTFLWSFLMLLAVLALLGQGAYRYRTEIAAQLPATHPALAAACEMLGCELRLPHRPELMSIDSSDLQADPKRENVIVLSAVIRNRARFAQEHPALELTLTDGADRALVRRVLLPKDYLDPRRATELRTQGIGPGAETLLRVSLDASRVRATGYRLYLFYP
jgi:predicted Zn finger-like uncharacterized protein